MTGVDARPYTLRVLDQRACGAWFVQADVLTKTLGVMFGGNKSLFINPFDPSAVPASADLTPDEKKVVSDGAWKEMAAFFKGEAKRKRERQAAVAAARQRARANHGTR